MTYLEHNLAKLLVCHHEPEAYTPEQLSLMMTKLIELNQVLMDRLTDLDGKIIIEVAVPEGVKMDAFQRFKKP